jgi:hypothetical protein
MLYLHGGGYNLRSITSHSHICTRLSRTDKMSVLLIFDLIPDGVRDKTSSFALLVDPRGLKIDVRLLEISTVALSKSTIHTQENHRMQLARRGFRERANLVGVEILSAVLAFRKFRFVGDLKFGPNRTGVSSNPDS